MISHKHKCIFIHIPKCAGTSFEKVLGHFDNYEERGRQDHRSVRMIQKPFSLFQAFSTFDNTKDSVRRMREHFRTPRNPNNSLKVNSEQYESYFKFTVVRNPWHRTHSWYKNVKRDPVHQKNYGIPGEIDFTSFVTKFAGKGYLRPQTYWLKQFNGQINLDHLGHFETLADTFELINNKFNLQETSLPHALEGKGTSISQDLTDEASKFIASYYAEEIELFGYSEPQ